MRAKKPTREQKKALPKSGSKRKGYRQLTREDFERYPIWELQHSLTTAEPYEGKVPFDADKLRVFFVSTRFTFADGSQAAGWTMICVPPYEVYSLSPTILTGSGQVDLTRLAKLPNQKDIDEALRRIGKTATQTFPLRFETDVPVPDGPAKAEMNGFLHRLEYEDDNGWSQHVDFTYLDANRLERNIGEFHDKEKARKAALEPTKEEKALLRASQSHDISKIRALIEKGVNLNHGGVFERGGYTWKNVTALMLAAELGDIEAIRLLIECGADVNAADDTNEPRKSLKTALLYACAKNQLMAARILLQAEADPNHRLSFGHTVFDEVCYEGTIEAIRLLLEFKADPNASCGKDYFALERAVSAGRLDVVKLLLESGADIDGSDDDGQTALIIATKLLRSEIFDLLLSKGANIKAATQGGWTPFVKAIIAATSNNPTRGGENERKFRLALKMADELLAKGADFNAVSKYGDTAMSLARECEFPDVLAYLESKSAK